MEPLALIAGAALFGWLMSQKPRQPAQITSQKIKAKRRAPVHKIKAKRTIVIVSFEPETKIGGAVMPQGWSYPIPFNEPWINVTALFAGAQ